MSASLIDRVRERLAAESGPLRPNVVAAAIRAESGGVLGDREVLSSLRVLQTELTGAGILEPLLCADGTTDVLVTAPDAVWLDDGNGLRRSSIRFADESAVRRLAQRLALSAGRRLDEAQPWVDGQLTGLGTGQFSVRLHAVLPPIAAGGTCLSLRVLRPATQDLATGSSTEDDALILSTAHSAKGREWDGSQTEAHTYRSCRVDSRLCGASECKDVSPSLLPPLSLRS